MPANQAPGARLLSVRRAGNRRKVRSAVQGASVANVRRVGLQRSVLNVRRGGLTASAVNVRRAGLQRNVLNARRGGPKASALHAGLKANAASARPGLVPRRTTVTNDPRAFHAMKVRVAQAMRAPAAAPKRGPVTTAQRHDANTVDHVTALTVASAARQIDHASAASAAAARNAARSTGRRATIQRDAARQPHVTNDRRQKNAALSSAASGPLRNPRRPVTVIAQNARRVPPADGNSVIGQHAPIGPLPRVNRTVASAALKAVLLYATALTNLRVALPRWVALDARTKAHLVNPHRAVSAKTRPARYVCRS